MVPGIKHLFARNYMEKCLKDILEIQELIDIILCVLLMHMINNSHYMLILVESVVVKKHHQIIQQYWNYQSQGNPETG